MKSESSTATRRIIGRSFAVAIKMKEKLSDVEKFTYLLSFVTGDAKRALEGLAVTNENFYEAVQILENRFGNHQVIVNSHMEELIKIKAVANKDDTKGLRELYDKVEMHLRSLRTLKVDPDNYGALLVPVMKAKLPGEINLLLSRKFDSNVDLWLIADMMKELRIEVEARERCATNTGRLREQKLPLTIEGLLVHGKRVGKSRLSCPYCEGGHFPDKCRTITNPGTRKQMLMEKKLCFLCTKGQHLANECNSKRKCFRCGGKHHTSICSGSMDEVRKKDKENVGEYNSTTAITAAVDEGGLILLQTARVQLMNPTTVKKGSCRLILDTGSQRTYISRKMQMDLGLKAAGTEYLSIGAFGGGTTRAKEHDVVEIAVQGGNSETLYMKAVVVEKICSPLQGQRINIARNYYTHLDGLLLADQDDGCSIEVEVLVGLDNYWRIVTGKIIRGNKGPVAIESKFGYVLSGPSKSSNFMVANESSIEIMTNTLVVDTNSDNLLQEIQKFWRLESIGISEGPTWTQKIKEKISFIDGKYEVELPWKETHNVLGDNYRLARNRLHSLLKRLRKDPEMLRKYADIMDQQIKDGILERVTEEMTPIVERTYYMPHQPVIREDKETTKLRIVYDGSSSENKNASLNECLEVPNACFTDLFAVLVRF